MERIVRASEHGTRVRIVHACVPLRLRILIFTQASLGDKSIFRGLLNILRMRT